MGKHWAPRGRYLWRENTNRDARWLVATLRGESCKDLADRHNARYGRHHKKVTEGHVEWVCDDLFGRLGGFDAMKGVMATTNRLIEGIKTDAAAVKTAIDLMQLHHMSLNVLCVRLKKGKRNFRSSGAKVGKKMAARIQAIGAIEIPEPPAAPAAEEPKPAA